LDAYRSLKGRQFVAQSFQTAGSAGFPVRHSIGRLESRPNPQVGIPALQGGSWERQHDDALPAKEEAMTKTMINYRDLGRLAKTLGI